MIPEIFGNLRELKTLVAEETYLVLVKIRLGPISSSHENSRAVEAADDLIAGLETDLSDIAMPFLTVRITYKHSGFLDQIQNQSSGKTGMSSFSTKMQSEATAVIQRTNLQSLWSPRVSRIVNCNSNNNSLIKLIETRFPVEKARMALRKLADDRVQIPQAQRPRSGNQFGQSHESILSSDYISSLDGRFNTIASIPLKLDPIGMDGTTDNHSQLGWDNGDDGQDPARKIWTEIRPVSRGEHDRSSTRNSVRTEDASNSPIRTNSEAAVEDERTRIKETALRNKRSLGEDSLRSIAPSVSSANSKPSLSPDRSHSGLALSTSSRWGWGGPWW